MLAEQNLGQKNVDGNFFWQKRKFGEKNVGKKNWHKKLLVENDLGRKKNKICQKNCGKVAYRKSAS